MDEARLKIILSSVFFVLGFSAVFAVLGVLLQGILSEIAYDARTYLNWVAGLIIIFFGLLMSGLLKVDFFQKEHKLKVKKTSHPYLTSFIFGGAFAIGWTPCVGAVLGAVLSLAITNPGIAFPMMLAYSIGLGLPFIIAAIFISRATGFIKKISPYLEPINLVFGLLLVLIGILIFTNSLSIIASAFPLGDIVAGGMVDTSGAVQEPNILLAFIAGFVSFLSPCVMPLVPAYLTFIAGTSIQETKAKQEN